MNDNASPRLQSPPAHNAFCGLRDIECIVLRAGEGLDEKRIERAWSAVTGGKDVSITSGSDGGTGLFFVDDEQTSQDFYERQLKVAGEAQDSLPLSLVVGRERQTGMLLLGWRFSWLHFDERRMASVVESFFDYCRLQREEGGPRVEAGPTAVFVSGNRKDAVSFWNQKLKGIKAPARLGPTTSLSTNASLPVVKEARTTIPSQLTERIQEFALSNNVPLEVLVHGAWALLLSRYSGEQDIMFCSGMTEDRQEVSDDPKGPYLNLARISVTPNQLLLPWLLTLRAEWLERSSHKGLSLEAFSKLTGGDPTIPVESVCCFHPSSVSDRLLFPLEGLAEVVLQCRLSDLPLTLDVDGGAELKLRMTYHSDHFPAGFVTRLAGHFKMLLESMPLMGGQELARLPWLTEDELRTLLIDNNQTDISFPAHKCAHELLEDQLRKTPDAPVVTCEGKTLTYAELHERANLLALKLQQLGVGPDSCVAIMAERSLEMMVGLLAIWKSGGAYVPLDPSYPTERLRYMLQDSGARVLLKHGAASERFEPGISGLQSVYLERQTGGSRLSPVVASTPSDLAYVIYTSGSTGQPKGVMLTHRNVVNFFTAMDRLLGTDPGVWLAVTSISFDISVLELFWPLTHGFKVIIQPGGGALVAPSGSTVPEQIRRHGVTHFQCTPSLMKGLLARPETLSSLKALKFLLLGGEDLPASLAAQLKQAGLEGFLNMYGPTETTVWSSAQFMTGDGETVSIGRPLANNQIYILTEQLQPVPVGVAGEIYIGGEGVARGYFNRLPLTEERFVMDPFRVAPGNRLYRTGDIGRWLGDGTLQCLGRVDNQVKIRGQRIELGEIETVLHRDSGIKEAVVVARQDEQGEYQLAAYLVSLTHDHPTPAELKEVLRATLSEAMIPAFFIFLEQLPLTPNGKIDRKALPAPAFAPKKATTPERLGNVSVLENRIIDLWSRVLARPPESIGLNDNFFDLGGHSLLVARMQASLREELGFDLPLALLFQHTTPAALAAHLGGDKTSSAMGATLQRGQMKKRGFRKKEAVTL